MNGGQAADTLSLRSEERSDEHGNRIRFIQFAPLEGSRFQFYPLQIARGGGTTRCSHAPTSNAGIVGD
jgi:hypothetical protein